MKQSTLWAVALVVILLVLGVWWYSTQNTPAAVLPEDGAVAGEEDAFVDDSKDGAPAESSSVTIRHTSGGFTPKTLTVSVGTRVTFVDEELAGGMWVASDEHPTHSQYSGTTRDSHCPDPSGAAFDQCAAGTTYSFVFRKTGDWAYHNHRNPDQKGVVIVVQ